MARRPSNAGQRIRRADWSSPVRPPEPPKMFILGQRASQEQMRSQERRWEVMRSWQTLLHDGEHEEAKAANPGEEEVKASATRTSGTGTVDSGTEGTANS